MNSSDEKVSLADLEGELDLPKELEPEDKARYELTYRLLGSFLLLVLIAVLVLMLAPSEKKTEALTVFEFVKTVVPPLVTLVIGFYFRIEKA